MKTTLHRATEISDSKGETTSGSVSCDTQRKEIFGRNRLKGHSFRIEEEQMQRL